jgi:hypothetical protein
MTGVIASRVGTPLRVIVLPLAVAVTPGGRFVIWVVHELRETVGYASDLTVNVTGVIALPTMYVCVVVTLAVTLSTTGLTLIVV